MMNPRTAATRAKTNQSYLTLLNGERGELLQAWRARSLT
jgi:hypothetical protein